MKTPSTPSSARAVTDNHEGRDEDIECWLSLIRAMGAVGVPTLGYNFKRQHFPTPPRVLR